MRRYGNPGEMLLRGFVLRFRGRGYPASQKLGTPTLLLYDGRFTKLTGLRNVFFYWIFRRLFGNGFRFTREEIRSLGR
jgi:hypothetical protein